MKNKTANITVHEAIRIDTDRQVKAIKKMFEFIVSSQ